MDKLEIISRTIEECPHYFDFRKQDFTGPHPTMANLDYDPFPEKGANDVVRTEIVARKLVLHATLKGDVLGIRHGVNISVDGHDFAVTGVKMKIDTAVESNSTADVEGEVFLAAPDPLSVLAQLRRSLARK